MALTNYVYYCSCLFLVGACLGAFGPLVPYWSQQQNQQPTFYTVFVYSRTIAYLLGIVVCKLFQNKLSFHNLLLIGLLFQGVFGLLFDLYDESIVIRTISYGLIFIGVSILEMITNITVIQTYQGEHLQLAYTVFQSWLSIGALAISQIIKVTQTKTYAFLGILSLILVPINILLPSPNNSKQKVQQQQQQQQQIQQNMNRWPLSNLSVFINWVVSMGFSSWISTYIVKRQLQTKEGALIFNTIFWLSRIVSSYVFPLIKGKTQTKINIFSLIGFASPLISLVLIYHVNSDFGLTFGCLMIGMPITVMIGLTQCQFQDHGFMITQKQILLVFFILGASQGFSAEIVKVFCEWISWEMLFYIVSILFLFFQILIIFQDRALKAESQRITSLQEQQKQREPQSQHIEVEEPK